MAFGQSIRFAKAFIEVGLDATQSQKQLRKFRNQMRSMRRIGIGVGASMAAALTPVAAILTKATIAAAKFEESLSRFNQEFGKLGPKMRQFTEEMVSGLGQSRQEMTDMLAGFNSMLKKGGAENAAALSKHLTKRAVDIASLYNRETVDVLRDMMAMLAGSAKTMEKYGTNVKMAAVNQELLNNNIDPKHASDYQKQLARINITMRETAVAEGDLARTQGSLTNQWRRAQNQIRNDLQELGTSLLPAVTSALTEMVKALKAMEPLWRAVAETAQGTAMAIQNPASGFTPAGQAASAASYRDTYGEIASRLIQISTPFGGGPLAALKSTSDLKATAGRGYAAQPHTAPQTPDVKPGEMPGLGADTISRGRASRAAFTKMVTRGFSEAVYRSGKGLGSGLSVAADMGLTGRDIPRAAAELAKGITGVKTSSDLFTTGMFGGDFVAKNAKQSVNVQKQLLSVQEELLAYVKEHSVVFG